MQPVAEKEHVASRRRVLQLRDYSGTLLHELPGKFRDEVTAAEFLELADGGAVDRRTHLGAEFRMCSDIGDLVAFSGRRNKQPGAPGGQAVNYFEELRRLDRLRQDGVHPSL